MLPLIAVAALATVCTPSFVESATHSLSRRTASDIKYINATFTNVTSVDLNVSVNGGGRNKTAPFLYGWMFEDINHSGDGGLYAEMITNRAFQGSTSTITSIPGIPGSSISSNENLILPFGPVITGWRGVGDVRLSLDLLHPLSEALPVVLELDIPFNATGEVGILNEGWWGMDVRPGTYNASFFILANAPRENNTLSGITASLRSNLTSDIWSTSTIPITTNLSNFEYTQFTTQIVSNVTAPNSNNSFAITFNASEVAGNTFYFGLVSLFPETFKNRPNGLRRDLGQAIKDLNPQFLRFPGGNNLEGYSIDQRWKWNETIGPLRYRKGRVGDWEYINTNGLGLLEFLEWTEDMEIEPVLAVYAGFSLDIWGSEGTSYPGDRMGDVLQDILNELEYCMGDTSTQYGTLRAQHGHPEPFQINFIEIGNEDWFSSTYPYRFPYLYQGIKNAYPNITLISTAYNEASASHGYNITIPAGGMWDTHHYEEPSYFLENFDFYDNWQEATGNENVTVFIGEYSVLQIDTPDGVVNFSDPVNEHIFYPRLVSAIAEAVYLLGAERNPNTVKLSSYAPSLQNFNWYNWTPNLLAFTANYNETVLSVSYYGQQLLAHYRGTSTLPVTNVQGDINPLFWVATIDEPSNTAYLKAVNAGSATVPLTINFDVAYSSVNGTILTNPDLNAFNFRDNRTAVVPVPASLPSQGSNTSVFKWNVPAYSITVLQFDLQ